MADIRRNDRQALTNGKPTRNRRPQQTAILVAQRIVSEIIDRGLRPGDSLASEREMLEQYAVARGTLREALRFLELQGVLSIKPGPGGGAIVDAPDERTLASVIALLLQFGGAPYRTILEARLVLEPALAAMAAERADEADLQEIAASVERMKAETDDFDAFLRENKRFHRAIAHAAGNELFELLLASLASIADGTALGVTYSERRRNAIASAHGRICDALAARDAEAAAEAMRAHIQEFVVYMQRRYASTTAKQLRWEEIA